MTADRAHELSMGSYCRSCQQRSWRGKVPMATTKTCAGRNAVVDKLHRTRDATWRKFPLHVQEQLLPVVLESQICNRCVVMVRKTMLPINLRKLLLQRLSTVEQLTLQQVATVVDDGRLKSIISAFKISIDEGPTTCCASCHQLYYQLYYYWQQNDYHFATNKLTSLCRRCRSTCCHMWHMSRYTQKTKVAHRSEDQDWL